MRSLRKFIDPFVGSPTARATYQSATEKVANPAQAIALTLTHLPPATRTEDQQPIFILSAGWRSGSTLLQRIVCSNPDHRTLVWGEPYDLSGIVQHMTATLLPIDDDWPPDGYFVDHHDMADLKNQWIANLYPPLDRLHECHRSFFRDLFIAPAEERGFGQWGIKEVRFGLAEARYLRWLFPKARFLFICRDPECAYASYAVRKRLWYADWPRQPMLTASHFGRHWRRLAGEFLNHDFGEDALLIRYEDLVSGAFDLERLDQFLGYPVSRDVLANQIGSSIGEAPLRVSRLDRWLIRRATNGVARQLGYFRTESGPAP